MLCAMFECIAQHVTIKEGLKMERGSYRPLSMCSIPSEPLEGIVCFAVVVDKVKTT